MSLNKVLKWVTVVIILVELISHSSEAFVLLVKISILFVQMLSSPAVSSNITDANKLLSSHELRE